MRVVTPWSQFLALLLLSAAGTAPAAAGTRFDFVAEAPGYTYKGRMALDGVRHRVDISEGNHPLFNANISIISRESGTEALVIDHGNRTYFQRQVGHIAGPLPTVRGIGKMSLGRSRVWKSRERIEDGGAATERHIVHAEYRIDMEVEGEAMRADVTLEARFDIDPGTGQYAHPWGLQYGAKTGFKKLDNALARNIPNRLPLRQVVTVSRQIADGPVVTETLTVTVSNVTDEEIPNGEFYAPDGYPYREPVFNFGQ